MRICYIIGAGNMGDESFIPSSGDLVIAADGGYDHLLRLKIKPDIVIGDFDSIKTTPDKENIFEYPVMKDDTDMMLAIKTGLSKGYKNFRIFGGLGGRLDHTIANIQSLAYIAENGGLGIITGSDQNITVIKNSAVSFFSCASGTISVFAFGGNAGGVTISGLLYGMDNGLISPNFPVGVSNSFTGKEACITVKDGMLVIMWTGNINDLNK